MRKSLALRAWEAVTPERDLKSVLAAVSEVLLPTVHFEGIGIIIFPREDRPRLFILHLTYLSPQPDTSEGQAPRRVMEDTRSEPFPSRAKRAYNTPRRGMSPGSDDLLAEPDWYPHEFRMAAARIRAYRSIPLVVRGARVGVAVFARREPVAFTSDEVEVLNEVSRALAVAVSNSLAYEEIRRLRDQLATENIALKEQLGQTP
ncbi:MAG: GAF domain-containing protein, partial [Bryobacteraceae bacterium]